MRSWPLRRRVDCRATLRRTALALCAAAAASVAVAGGSAAAASRPVPGAHMGRGLVGYPTWLPKRTLHFDGDSLLVGTVKHPALTNQGDPVKVVTPHWSAVAVVEGPEVPGEGLPYQTASTTCTWTVTLTKASRAFAVDVADFDSVDSTGALFHPALVPDRPVPPSVLEPGQTMTFELRAAEPVGEGLMRWAPDGRHIEAKWDFVVEND